MGGLYYWFWARGACWRIVLLVFLEELVGGLSQGAPVAGNFGLGGQETVRNPGARETDRLFLAGWEVSQFWASFSFSLDNRVREAWTDRVGEQHHLRGIYFHYYGMFIIVMMVHYFTMLYMLFNMLFISCCSF
jgi:hypothetical protein